MTVYYAHGRQHALVKLGMDAGPAPYAATETRDSSFSDNKKQLLWKSMDDEPFMTGEESGVGMPSPSKEASENDGGYGEPSGPYGAGAYDANADKVDRDQRNSDSVARGFETNRLLDQSYAPEVAMTQPHGSKMAGLMATTGLSRTGITSAVNAGRMPAKLPSLNKSSILNFKGIGQNRRAATAPDVVHGTGLAGQATGAASGRSISPPNGNIGTLPPPPMPGAGSISPTPNMGSVASPPTAASTRTIKSPGM